MPQSPGIDPWMVVGFPKGEGGRREVEVSRRQLWKLQRNEKVVHSEFSFIGDYIKKKVLVWCQWSLTYL